MIGFLPHSAWVLCSSAYAVDVTVTSVYAVAVAVTTAGSASRRSGAYAAAASFPARKAINAILVSIAFGCDAV